MKVTGENGLGDLLKGVLQICFYLGVFVLLVLPFALKPFGLNLGASVFVIYPNGIVLLMIAYQFIKLFDSLKMSKPFCENNVKILKKTGIIAFSGAWLWMIDLLYEVFLAKTSNIIFYIAMIFLFVLYIGVSIALYILSELFKQATEYKEENELTI